MGKKIVAIIFAMLMCTVVGCTKSTENTAKKQPTESNIEKQLDNKYIYFDIKENSWQNNKYGYSVYETYIAEFNKQKAALYSIKEDGEEKLIFKGDKLDKNGNGITYNFLSKKDQKYKLYVYLDKKDNDKIKIKLDNPSGDIQVINTDLLTKEECADKIKARIDEVELNNMIKNKFTSKSGLDLNGIKSDIDNARKKVYQHTKKRKQEVYYVYTPSGSYCNEDDSFKLKYYVFVEIALDENGNMDTVDDGAMLVNAKDGKLYRYMQDGTVKEFNASDIEENQDTNDNINEADNNQYSSDSINNMPSEEQQKKDRARIMAEYGPSTKEHSVCVSGEPEFYNNEWCYMVATGYKTATGMDKANQFYVGSKTLNLYEYSDVVN